MQEELAARPGGRRREPRGTHARVHPETVTRIERSMGPLGTAAIAAMDERLPWFRKMTAENRSWLGLVAQAGIASFVDWIKHPERMRPAATEVFGTAPRELARAVRLQQAVEMVRVIIDVVESQVDTLAAPGAETELREAVLVYAREIAFSAAQVYARTAEARGAWDARLEALVVDSLVRGEQHESLNSWASALNWSSSPVSVLAGTIDGDDAEPVIDELRAAARRARLDLIAGVQGGRLIVVLGGTDDPMAAAEKLAGLFGPGPLVVGPAVRDLRSAHVSARAALAGLRVAPAWPDAPRPASSDELLPERALDGDADAVEILVTHAYQPLLAGGTALLDTLTTYLEQGSSLEATRPDALRPPEHGPLPAAPGHRADRLHPGRRARRLHAVDRGHPRPPRRQAGVADDSGWLLGHPAAGEWYIRGDIICSVVDI